jgi:hypothetical protein
VIVDYNPASFTAIGISPDSDSLERKTYGDFLRKELKDKNLVKKDNIIHTESLSLGLVFSRSFGILYSFGFPLFMPSKAVFTEPENGFVDPKDTPENPDDDIHVDKVEYTYSATTLFYFPRRFVRVGLGQYTGRFLFFQDKERIQDQFHTVHVRETVFYVAIDTRAIFFPLKEEDDPSGKKVEREPDKSIGILIESFVPYNRQSFIYAVVNVGVSFQF